MLQLESKDKNTFTGVQIFPNALYKIIMKLNKVKAFEFRGCEKYLIILNTAAGKKNRYTVIAGDNLIIGREVKLKTAKQLIKDHEQ